MESENVNIQDQTILISDDDDGEDDMLCDEDETISEGNNSVIIISDDNNSNNSDVFDHNLVTDSSLVTDSDSESEYIRITSRPGPKSRTRLKRSCKKSFSESIKKKRRIGNAKDDNHYTDITIPNGLIECDTDISSDNDKETNICNAGVDNEICLDTSIECDENDDNIIEIKKNFVSDISQEKDVEKKTNDYENENDGSNKLICPYKCDTDISGENESKTNVDLHNENDVTDISMLQKVTLENLNKPENDTEKNEMDKISLETLSELEDAEKKERNRLILADLTELESYSNKYDIENMIHNKLVSQALNDITIDTNIDSQETKNDGDKLENEAEINETEKNESEKNETEKNENNRISIEILDELDNDTEKKERITLAALTELESYNENYEIIDQEIISQKIIDDNKC